MKKIFSLILVFSLFVALVPGYASAQAPQERIIILFKEKVDKKLISTVKGKINREYKQIPALAVTVPAAALKGIQKNPNVLVAEQDIIVKVNAQTADWGIQRTAAPESWNSGLTGKGVKVAIVDTGIVRHDDLLIAGGASFVAYTGSYEDDNGHGTHVAGIVGARNNGIGTVGIAPESSIYAVKSLDQNGSGYLSDIIAGIDWSIQNNMDIINLSLGTTSHSATLQQVVDKAYGQNILVVAAAGNNGAADGSGDTVNYPARYSSVIAVAATDSADKRASFSATGSTLEVAAPGVSVLSTYLNNQYGRMSGTSMAAPYTAGNLALLKQADSTLTAAELRLKLQQDVIDLGAGGKDSWFGHGLIQAPVKEASVQEPADLELNTAIATNKTVYRVGDTVYVTVTAYDKNGLAVSGANAKVSVHTPLSTSSFYQGTTDSKGQFKVVYKTSRLLNPKGIYTIQAENTKTGYQPSAASAVFQLK